MLPKTAKLQQKVLDRNFQRLLTLESTVKTLEKLVSELQVENATLNEKVSQQEALILKYQSMLFGSKSEKNLPATSAHTTVVKEIGELTPDEPSPRPKGQRGQRRGAPGHGRRLYEELPPREVIHELPASERQCPSCGKSYLECGTEDSTTIEWEVHIRRVIHKRVKYLHGCDCHTPVMLTAPAAPKLLPKGLLEVSAISNLIVNKFLHSQPINRQLRELELLCGVRFSPGTLVGVQEKVATLLRPLYQAILLHLREADHWHADETRWMQYADENKHRWWLWVFASSDAVAFVLDPSRSRAVPRRVFGLDDPLENARRAMGIVSCDRWKSYQGIPGIETAYCWTHVRRDFIDLAKSYPRRLGEWSHIWVKRIATLYHLNDQRLHYQPGTKDFRQADARLRDHVAALARLRETEAADQSLLLEARKALDSMARHWEGLTLFLDHPDVPLDNNEAERLLRIGVVGRKNFYGCGSGKSGELTESAYSVLLTTIKHNLNPLTYLRAYLDACAENGGNPPEDIDRFLPWNASKEDLAAWKLPPLAV